MNGNGEKISITYCPFQTQIGGPVKTDQHRQILLGSAGIPIIKVACDKEKCELWDRNDKVCAVSNISLQISVISGSLDCLESAIRDISDNFPAQTIHPD